MLLGAKLTNFKKHKSLEVTFTEGMNVIRGPNYAGKSTVLSAIAFALYGIKAIGSEKEELVTTGEKSCMVEIPLITPGGDEVIIIRTNRDAKVLRDGKSIATGNSTVTKWVESTFGADVKEFLTHTYSRQMETSVLLTTGASELQRKVENMAKVSIIDQVIKAAHKSITYLNGRLDGLFMGEKSLEEIKTEIAEKQVSVKQLEISLKGYAEVESKLALSMTSLLDKLSKDNSANESITLAIDEVSTVTDDIAYNEDKQIEWKKILHKFPKGLEDKFDNAEKQESEFLSSHLKNMKLVPLRASKVQSIETYINWIKNEGEPNVELAKSLLPKIKEKTSEALGYDNDYKRSKEIIRELQGEINALEKSILEGVCPTCERDYENFNKEVLLEKLEVLKNKQDCEWVVANKASSAYKECLEQLTPLEDEYPGEGTEDSLREAEEVVARLETELEALEGLPSEGELNNASQTLESLKKVAKELGTALSDQEDAKLHLEHANSSLIEFKRKLSELTPMANKKLVDTTDTVSKISKAEKDSLEVKELSYEGRRVLDQASFSLEHLEGEEGKIKQAEKIKKNTEKKLKLTKDLQKYLRESRSRFLGTIWGSILARASEIAASTTQGQVDQITEIRRRDNGTFAYVEKGVEFSVRSASGCQQEIMGVALRLALCDLFYGQGSFIMLDEASSQMNEENSAALAGVLAATGKQILYVTHRDAEQTVANNVIFIGGEK